jgi:hypothetical protein
MVQRPTLTAVRVARVKPSPTEPPSIVLLVLGVVMCVLVILLKHWANIVYAQYEFSRSHATIDLNTLMGSEPIRSAVKLVRT